MVWATNMFAACEWEQWWMSLFCGSNTWVWPAKLHQPHIIYTLFNTYHFNISVVHLLLSEMKSPEFCSFLTVKSFIRNAKPSTADLQRYKKIHREIQRFNVYFYLFIMLSGVLDDSSSVTVSLCFLLCGKQKQQARLCNRDQTEHWNQ